MSQDCESFHVSVSLNHDTTSDRSVMIETTIPGTTGIGAPGNHYNTSFGEIWSASGPAPASGTVTLIIDNGTSEEFRTSSTLVPAEGCEQPRTTPTPTPTHTPSATPTPAAAPTATPREDTLGGTPTPAPLLPDTAVGAALASPALLTGAVALVLLAAVGSLAWLRFTSRGSTRP